MSARDDLNLETLGDNYDVLGELAGRDNARVFMAKRKADGLEVLLVVAHQPEGDQGNALSHLAADVNLLASAQHRAVAPVLEGRWLGTDAFATVVRRPSAPTLHELLSRRDEDFDFARIAMILREVSGALEWAREHKVVQRAVTPDTLYIEPGSDRVSVSFALTALSASGVPGSDADARCIARLARAMFTRSPAAPQREARPLAELRPGLPKKVIDETDALLAWPRPADAAPADVTGYIARIAMADALKGGEEYLEATRNIIEEQRRIHEEQLEKERREHEEQLATERKEYERLAAGQSEAFAKERESFARKLDKEHIALDKERAALVKERAIHARDCEELSREREEHAKDRAALLEERARQEQLTKVQRDRIAAEAAEFRTKARQHAEAAKRAEEARKVNAHAAAPPKRQRFEVESEAPVAVPWPKRQRDALPQTGRRDWKAPLAAAVVVVLITATAISLAETGHRFTLPGMSAVRKPAPTTTANAQARPGSPATAPDSAGGEVSSYRSVVPLPEVTTDTATLAAAASDWTPPPKRPVEREPVERSDPRDSYQRDNESRLGSRLTVDSVHVSEPTTRVDTIYGGDPYARPVAPPRRDTMRPYPGLPRRDSVTRVDTIFRRDTTQY